MGRGKINLIIIALYMFFVSNTASAQTLNALTVKTAIEQASVNDYKKYTNAQLEAKVMNMPFLSIEIPDGAVTYQVQSNFERFMQNDIKKVAILVDGKPVRSFVTTVNTKAYADVLVAAKDIEREQLINTANTKLKRVDIADKMDYVINQKNLEKEILSRKFLKEGEVIDKRFVKLSPDVRRNGAVSAYFKNSDILISIEATALQDGMLGEFVEIENKVYKRKYRGQVVGENKVLISI